LDRALAWLDSDLHSFVPSNREGNVETGRIKALAELATLCACHARSFSAGDDERVNRMLHHIAGVVADSQYQSVVARTPEFLNMHAIMCASLEQCGLLQPELVGWIQSFVDIGFGSRFEVQPTIAMSFRYAFDRLGVGHTMAPMKVLIRASLLDYAPAPFSLSLEDGYYLTHGIFYMTDYGFERPPVGRATLTRLSTTLNGANSLFLRRNQTDLVAELLAAGCCLRTGFDLSLESWRLLDSVQDPAGFLTPSPGQAKGDFQSSNHTTIVAALAACLTLREQRDHGGRPAG
jgi:hypothetical protein